MQQLRYECDICERSFDSLGAAEDNLMGFEIGSGTSLVRKPVQDVHRHLCWKCLEQLSMLMNQNKPKPGVTA
jgi:hypothetical protein